MGMKPSEINQIDKLLFTPCGLELSNVRKEKEGEEYSAHTFQLSERKVKFRIAKTTPTKTGQFVAIWKRNKEGITEPFESSDDIDFLIIATKKELCFGCFILPKAILHEKRILSDSMRDGKRGMRVYSTWDATTNKQAQKTQEWMSRYFFDLSQDKPINFTKAKELFSIES